MARRTPTTVGSILLMVGLIVSAACSPGDVDVVAARSDRTPQPAAPTSIPAPEPPIAPIDPVETTDEPDNSTLPPTTQEEVTDTEEAEPPLTQEEIDALLAELVAADFCDPDDVRDDGIVTAMHFVVQGDLQPPCYVDQRNDGDDVDDVVLDDDPRLITAWESLVAVTPPELVSDISLIAGYEPCSTCDTLAFVTTLDEDATFFLMAVDVVSGDSDPDELRLTMMHELTHVFAQKAGEQLDIAVLDASACPTFYNGAGCFTPDSYVWAWIQEFWPPEVLASLPADGSVATDDEAADRCSADPRYTGSYAAVHPEEDFAESFSAYVYDVEVDVALAAKFAFFDRYPEFVSIRDNARSLGLAGTEAEFEGCG